MLEQSEAFAGFSVDDTAKAKQFYGEVLGVDARGGEMGVLTLRFPGGGHAIAYPKQDHRPADYTVLNFPVEDVEATVDALSERGVEFERYDGFEQDDKGIMRGAGPTIAWFKDPAGNILSVLETGSH